MVFPPQLAAILPVDTARRSMTLLRFLPDRWKEQLRRRAGVPTPLSRLENLRHAGFSPRAIIDAGAYRGEWARLARAAFPSSRLLLIEAQPQLRPALEAVCAELGDAQVETALLGAGSGKARFLLSETNSRVVPPSFTGAAGDTIVELPRRRLDEIASNTVGATCDLLKLDLQGFELEALSGAGNLFGAVEVIVAEVSWLQIGEPPLIAEVLTAFGERGYQPYDIWGFNYRPLDRALWQTDVAFVRRESSLLRQRSWA